MSVKAYMLLDIVDGSSEYAIQMLRSRAGVVFVDCLEGSPDIIAMVEAPNRQRLAETIMPVIGCIDGITEDLHLLVTRDNEILPSLTIGSPFPGIKKGEKTLKRERKIEDGQPTKRGEITHARRKAYCHPG